MLFRELVPTDSLEFPEFHPIPELRDGRVAVIPYSCLLHPIPERNSGNSVKDDFDGITRIYTEFPPIPELSDGRVALIPYPCLLHPVPERNSGN